MTDLKRPLSRRWLLAAGLVVPSLALAGRSRVSGTWAIRYEVNGEAFQSTMALEDGSTVTGRYGSKLKNKLCGLWVGKQLIGVWVEGSSQGWFRFDFDDDTFTGEYGHLGGESLGSWNGEQG